MLDLSNCNGKKDIESITLEEVTAQMVALGEKSFRAEQLYDWMHVKLAEGFDGMSSLSIPLRQKLKENYSSTCLKMADERVFQMDGTRRCLFGLEDGYVTESAWMQYYCGNSVYISSQVGRRMGCRFCASTLDGLERNLRLSEMLEQIYRIQFIIGGRVSDVVVMESGEPMDNYDNVIRFLRLVSHERGLDIGQKSLTISTCGTVLGIRKFTEEDLVVTLALFLHASSDEVGKTLVLVADSYKLQDVLEVCRYYYEETSRRLTSEYNLIRSTNDNLDEARVLVKLIKDQHSHVNLIPVNPIKEWGYIQPGQGAIQDSKNLLEKSSINVTIRRETDRDIGGVCGQLRRNYKETPVVPQCTEGEG